MFVNIVENPSFEDGSGDKLPGWEVVGSTPEQVITSGDAHSGNKYASLVPVGNELRLLSKELPVHPRRRYGLTWWTRLNGERPWHWTYLTRFTGVEVDFFSQTGRLVGRLTRRIRCLRTRGWVKSWTILDIPSGARHCRVSFVLDSPKTISMQMDLDDVKLTRIEPNPPEGKGRIRILAYADGEGPTYARFSVHDESGTGHYPEYSYPFKSGEFYHVNDPMLNYLDLQPGSYRLRATKGLEFDAAETTVVIKEGETRNVRLNLPREWPLGDWVSGDHHVHLFFHKDSLHPQMTISDVMKIAKGEGLNFVSFCGEWSEFTGNLGDHEIEADNHFVGEVGLESVNDFYGHMCTLNWKSVPVDGVPMRLVPWPMNIDTIRHLYSTGGAWVNAHPFDSITPGHILEEMENPRKLCNARELPLILALQGHTNMDLLCHATPGGAELKTKEYYRLLNMGFKIGATASTDYYVDQARGTPGHNRTYVHVSRLDFDSIAEAYRSGRTYATNGPIVYLDVDGVQIGDELDLPAGGRTVQVTLKAYSRMGLSKAQIIVNGDTVRTIAAEGKRLNASVDLDVRQSCWIAAYIEGPVNRDVEPWDLSPDQRNLKSQFAHTSPVYIKVGEQPIRPDPSDIAFLSSWLDAIMKAFRSQPDIWNGYPDEPYLASSYTAEDRERITRTLKERIDAAKEALRSMLGS